MARLKVGKPLTEGAPKAAAKVRATARASMAGTASTLGDYLRDQRTGARLTLRQLAEQAGVSNPYLSQIERGLRKPSADVLQQLAKALRISAETLYVRAGILDPDDGGERSVQIAVLGDSELSERQKQVLLDIYTSFRRENDRNADQD
jgi:transcriptional regulator with XRE-family HTH domain